MARTRLFKVIYNPFSTSKVTKLEYVYAEDFVEAIEIVTFEVEPINWDTVVAYPVDDDNE